MQNSLKIYSHKTNGMLFRDIILGGQDGLVNVLGLILGVYTATSDPHVILISGLAAGLAEAVSMGAVAYTSLEAEKEFYLRAYKQEQDNIKNFPDREKEALKELYRSKGLPRTDVESIVDVITSNKSVWLSTIMAEKLRLSEDQLQGKIRNSIIIGSTAAIGAMIPLSAFFFISNVHYAMSVSLGLSAVALFTLGFVKGTFSQRSNIKSGLELLLIGMSAALIGFLVGKLFTL